MRRIISLILTLCLMISFGIVGAYAEDMQQTGTSDPFGRVTLDAGSYHFIGLKEDGTVVAGMSDDSEYGSEDDRGQCDVGAWTNIVSVAGGFYLSLGLRSDGTVLMAGDGNSYKCDVSDWTDIVDIAAGYQHCVGLRSDGTVITTGLNDNGQRNVEGWTDIVDVAAGAWHTLGLRSDGTVVAVGENEFGQCNVSGWTDIVAIDGNCWCSVGLKSDGTVVYAGGYDDSDRQTLDTMKRWSNVVAIRAFGNLDVFGITADGRLLDINESVNEADRTEAAYAVLADWTDTAVLKQDGTVAGGNHVFDGVKLQLPAAYTLPETKGESAEQDMGIWILRAYVDEFDMPTDDYFIVNERPFYGKFSNSATTNSELWAYIFYNPGNTNISEYVTIRLFEYGNYRVNNPYSHSRDYDIIIMDKDGNKSYLSGTMPSQASDISVWNSDAQTILDALKMGGTVRLAITESDDSLTKYIITIDDATGFDTAFRAYWAN